MKSPPPEGVIWRVDLLQQLVRAAQIRSIVTMMVSLPAVLLVIGLAAIPPLATIATIFGISLTVAFALTQLLCRPMVKCPHCGRSLWKLGTGNFKPRRMRIRSGATGCSGCGARLV